MDPSHLSFYLPIAATTGLAGLPALLVTVLVALSISFLCSILEATLLSSRIPELSARRDDGDQGAEVLLELKQERIDDAISAILTLNTIAHTIGAAVAGAQAAVVFGDAWVGLFSGVLTVLVLVVTEIIPKTIGTVYASPLVGFVGRTTSILIILLKPVLFLTGLITRAVAHGSEVRGVSRSEVAALVTLATEDGALQSHESRILESVLSYESILVQDVMTPRTVVTMLAADMPIGDLLQAEKPMPFSRLPLFEGTRDNVIGYVLQREVLWHAACDLDPATPVRQLMRPLGYIPETDSVAHVLRSLIEAKAHMAVVGDEFGGAVGIVTLEDLVETVLGMEIIDESDEVVDLRELAKQLRLRRLQERGLQWQTEEADAAAPADADDPDSGSRPDSASPPSEEPGSPAPKAEG